MPTVSLGDITEAFEFAGADSGAGKFAAFICKRTGKIYYQTDFPDSDEFDDELPEDIDDEKKYVALPDRRELDLGQPLVFAFVRQHLPADVDDVRRFFGKRGAYGKFNALLARRGMVNEWHAFENEATDQALRDWCALNSIEIIG